MNAPLELIISVYPSRDQADRVLANIRRAVQNGVFEFQGAAIVTKDEAGKVRLDDTQDVGPGRGALLGAITGGLIGLLAGPGGAIAGLLAGAATGGVAAGLLDLGFANDQLMELQASLRPGSSALIVLIEHTWIESLVDELERERGRLFRHAVNPLLADQYRQQDKGAAAR